MSGFGFRISLLLTLSSACFGDTLRVATWSFQAHSDTSPIAEDPLNEAATALKKLNPDVILLERVRDWQMCTELAQALKPADYTVLVCSAFREMPAAKRQVAILSKRKGYFSWSESWQSKGAPGISGGFAIVAIQFGNQRVCFFSTQMDGQLAPENDSVALRAALSHQWAQTLDTFRSWVTNRLGAVVVASGDLAPGSKEAEYTVGLLSAPFAQPVTVGGGGTQPEGSASYTPIALAADPEAVPGVILIGHRTACELDLNPAKPHIASPAPFKLLSVPGALRADTATLPQPISSHGSRRSTFKIPQLWLWSALASLFLLVLLWARRRRPRPSPPAALPGPTQIGNGVSYNRVVRQQSITSSSSSPRAQLVLPERVPQGEISGSRQHPLAVWPPGPLPFDPKAQPGAERDRAGLLLHLSHWLKQKLVQRLITDRAHLLKAQQAATVKLLSFEARLASIERQLQQQNQAYEQRIEELNRELLAAKEENRELIRARITQVKWEMESARARLLAQVKAGDQ